MNYTKGEWKAYRNALGTWAVSTDNEPIAQVDRHYNAHLIAAAPELYEALKELRDWLQSEDVHLLGKGMTEQMLIPKTFEKTDKALAKAEGGS